ncbi:MAG: hypothetical protein KY475_00940 [Planctomycetes bacterium]|nr:hypothetical protein [Planctomycetota bacterium]
MTSKVDRLQRDYQRLLESGPPQSARRRAERVDRYPVPRLTSGLTRQAQEVVQRMDQRGAWVERGELRRAGEGEVNEIIETRDFIENVEVLSRFIAASPSDESAATR